MQLPVVKSHCSQPVSSVTMDFDADKISWQQVSKKNNPFKRLKIYLAVSRTRRLSDVIESDTLSVK